MIIKLVDQIRRWKKDNNDKDLDWSNLEFLANQFDAQNQIEIEKMELLKERSNLENEKLKIEIEKMKSKKLFTTSRGNSFEISKIKSIRPHGTRYLIHVTGIDYFIYISSDEHRELLEKIG